MVTRTCRSCAREKTIRGVWYLLTVALWKDGPSFECEGCYERGGATAAHGAGGPLAR